MGWSYHIDLDKRRVTSTVTGVIGDTDLQEHMNALGEDPDFGEDLDQLMDLTGASKIEVTSAMVRDSFQASPFGSGSRRAIVASSDLAFGLARMFQILRDDHPDEIEVFRGIEEAGRFLDGGKE